MAWTKEEYAAWARNWRATPEGKRRTSVANRRAFLKKRYGITPEEYDALRVAQGDRCAICGEEQKHGRIDTLFVDHAHGAPGTHRALLCHQCNLMIGNARENPELLEMGAAYLRKWEHI